MNCAEVNELSPLWHSGELEASSRRAFDAHVASCPECAAEIREQWTNDARLREAIAAEPADTSELERRVINQIAQIARERFRKWLVPGMAAAAAVVGAVLLFTAP